MGKPVDIVSVVLLSMIDERCAVLAAFGSPAEVIEVENYFINKFHVDRGFIVGTMIDSMPQERTML